jgi:hypothetical protein
MSATTWTIHFGKQGTPTAGESEYFCFISDADGSPVDTFYSSDAQEIFEGVGSLLKSQATGIGFG